MNNTNLCQRTILLIAFAASALRTFPQETRQLAIDKPQAIADLRSAEGAASVNAQWSTQTARIVEKSFRSPGPKQDGSDPSPLYPTGAPVQTNYLTPQIGDANFYKNFQLIKPTELEKRQGNGLLSFVWYKVDITIPAQVGKFPTKGSTAVFEIVVDDYSEVWVNGKQASVFGQSGNGVISGYNSRNRIVLTDNANEGDQFSIAILAINGAVGHLPENYIWIRNAVIDFYITAPSNHPKNIGKIYTIDEQLNSIIAPGTKVEKIADGFSFTEGPVWHPDGFLLFSDPNTNTIYRYNPVNQNVTVYISHSGYTGTDIGEYHQPGSNGLAIDKDGRLIVAQHGNRQVIRHEKKGPVTILSNSIDGKRLNSPNDVVIKSDGTVYFTDPPYGLPGAYNDKRKETAWQGVYMIRNGKTVLVSKDLGGPNGLAFSPDEKYFYVTNWDVRDIHHTKTIWRYEVLPDGTLQNGKVFCDFSYTEDDEALDGLKIDKEGNLFVSAPGGVWIVNPQAQLLGKIVTPERPANMAWGDDGKTLYLTAHSSLYKIRVITGGKFSWQ